MKVLLINGSPHKNGCTFTALSEVEKALNECNIETEIFHIGAKPIRGCMGCASCAKKDAGLCRFDDDTVNEAIIKLKEADGLIVGSPVHYAGASGSICSFMDRLFFGSSKYYAYKPAAAVVSSRRGGASAAFDRLNKYFTIAAMPVVSSFYWNSIHGNTPDEVKKDLEGMQTMRMLGRNMAWLLKSIEEGKKAGITPPEREKPIATNFIR